MPGKLFQDISKAFRDTQRDLKKGESHCMDLCLEVTKMNSEHFNKIDTHFEGDGLLCTYACSLDGRKYDVMITPQKETPKKEISEGISCKTCNTNTECSCEGCNEMLCDGCATEVTGEVALTAIKEVYKIDKPHITSIRLCKDCIEKYTALTK
jgi:hypothetical protein